MKNLIIALALVLGTFSVPTTSLAKKAEKSKPPIVKIQVHKKVTLAQGGFVFLGKPAPGETVKTDLRPHELTTAKPLADVFRAFGKPERLCVPQQEVKEFVLSQGDRLLDRPTFFLRNIGGELFVTEVYFDVGLDGFGLVTFPMEEGLRTGPLRQIRVVVPKR